MLEEVSQALSILGHSLACRSGVIGIPGLEGRRHVNPHLFSQWEEGHPVEVHSKAITLGDSLFGVDHLRFLPGSPRTRQIPQ